MRLLLDRAVHSREPFIVVVIVKELKEMALGFAESAGGGGDILPIIKWDAKGGDLIRQDRFQAPDGMWTKDESEVPLPAQFIMDLENIEVGFLSFASGAPDFRVAKIGEPRPVCPPDLDQAGKPAFKPCFRVRIKNKELGLREFSHSAKTVLRTMDDLHNQFESALTQNHGKVPVVEISETEVVKINTPQGELRFKVPKWNIVQWVDRSVMTSGAQSADAVPSPSVPEPALSAASAPPANSAGADLF